jgi:RimJ/RimL family protein N-acetyltransferase
MKLEGLLVDLVPYSNKFLDMEHKWMNSEGIYFWAVGARWIVTKAGLERDHREDAERDEHDDRIRLGVQLKDGTPIGLFATPWISTHNRFALLSAYIAEPEYWGGGYGTDGLLLFIDFLFDWYDLRKVWLQTMALNARVLRQMEKTGFTREGNARGATFVDGAWVDMPMYGLLREEWPGRETMIEQLGLRAKG